jgi:hypothetical protein
MIAFNDQYRRLIYIETFVELRKKENPIKAINLIYKGM